MPKIISNPIQIEAAGTGNKIIQEFFEKQGLSKNKHKKKAVKYIKWKN